MRTLHGAALKAHLEAVERRKQIREDYQWLIDTGETHGEALARRLRFPSVSTFERYLYRNQIPVRHECCHNSRTRRAA